MSDQPQRSSWQAQADAEYEAWKAQQAQPPPATAKDLPKNFLKDVATIPAEMVASIPNAMRAVSGDAALMGQMGEGLLEHYKGLAQHPLQNFYERPIATVMDVVAPLRGGAGLLKAARVPGAATASRALAAADPAVIAGKAVNWAGQKASGALDRASVRLMSGALKPTAALERSEPRSAAGPTPDIEKTARAARDTGLVLTPRRAQGYLDESSGLRQEKRAALAAHAKAGDTVDFGKVARSGYAAANTVRRGSAAVPRSQIAAANLSVGDVANSPTHRQQVPGKPGKFRPGKLSVDKADQTKRDLYQQAKASFDINKQQLPADIVNRVMAKEIRAQMPNDIREFDAAISRRAPVNAAIRQAMPRITNRAPVPASALMGMLGGGLFNYMLGGNLTHGMLPGLMLGAGLGAVNSPWGASHLSQATGRWAQTLPGLSAGVGAGLRSGGSAARVTEDAMREALLNQLAPGSTERPR